MMAPDNRTKPLFFTPNSTADWVAKYSKELTLYQNETYAERYQALVAQVVRRESKAMLENTELATVVAKAAFKLMAYKDEYEVARLYSQPEFLEKLEEQFEGDYRLQFNLSPPIIAPKDKNTGKPDKIQLGGWMLSMFGLLAKFKFLRGTRLDPFGYLADRKIERDLIKQYFDTIELLIKDLNSNNYELAIEIARVPMSIRGYGHIKHESVLKAREQNSILLKKWSEITEQDIAV
jgi:indolepyruvate ferredoxin oxidoreductase